ncbi:src-like-adapter 2 isoform X2 [Carettochelys insculpta]|uniref:src-like-adapter 2 isoform X2 n=1 Tax=Carettochelys insculpta TaxID=44489 RepID=UPI003EBE682B
MAGAGMGPAEHTFWLRGGGLSGSTGSPSAKRVAHATTPTSGSYRCPHRLPAAASSPQLLSAPCGAVLGFSAEHEPPRWLYEGVSREKAEELLLLPCNHSGSFLIRESQTRRGGYSLSVRHSNRASWDSVKHYRIHRLENGWLYIAPRLTFPSLQALVDHYSEIAEGLCCLLKEPCFIQGAVRAPAQALPPPVVVKKATLNWQELNSAVLFSEAPPADEESPVSLGLREAISSYLFLSEGLPPESGSGEKDSEWKSA